MTSDKVSRPGEYSGYSKRIYSEVIRSSRYLYIRGNNLAIDIYRPAKEGIAVEEPYPAFRYNRKGLLALDLTIKRHLKSFLDIVSYLQD